MKVEVSLTESQQEGGSSKHQQQKPKPSRKQPVRKNSSGGGRLRKNGNQHVATTTTTDYTEPAKAALTSTNPTKDSTTSNNRQHSTPTASPSMVKVAEWTWRNMPATAVGYELSEIAVSNTLLTGLRVVKTTTRGQLCKRILTVSYDRYGIFCTHATLHSANSSTNDFAGVLSTWAGRVSIPWISRKGIRWFNVGRKSSSSLRESYVRYIDVADMDYVSTGTISTLKLELARRVCDSAKDKNNNNNDNNINPIEQDAEQIVSLAHHGGTDTLDIFVPDKARRRELVDTLQRMIRTYQSARLQVSHEALLLRYIWDDIDRNRDGVVSEKEFSQILVRINFHVPHPNKHFHAFINNKNNSFNPATTTNHLRKRLEYMDIMLLLQSLKQNVIGKTMSDIIWESVFGVNTDFITADDFLSKFVQRKQGETETTLDQILQLFEQLNAMEIMGSPGMVVAPSPHIKTENTGEQASYGLNTIGRNRFEVFLYSEFNDAYNPVSQQPAPKPTMDYPLSYYWINTSHNTYLTGDQLQSKSSTEMYVRALRRGCRCLELDCWDGEQIDNGDSDSTCIPVVYHGYTLTSKILFQDIITVIHAYVKDHPDTYPIILSLENHCSEPFQLAMSLILKVTLGPCLYIPPSSYSSLNIMDPEGEQLLPSPEALRGKVVIKGKRPPEAEDAIIPEEAATLTINESNKTKNEQGVKPGKLIEPSVRYDYEDEEEEEGEALSNTDGTQSDRSIFIGGSYAKRVKKSKHSKIVPELARLTLFHGAKYKDFESSLQDPVSYMHSIGETKIDKILTRDCTNVEKWREYNTTHMTRTYPAGTRVESSNYNPLMAWSMGCQMVALNIQTYDAALAMNDGLFRQNNNCGYVLKPPSVMNAKRMNTIQQARDRREKEEDDIVVSKHTNSATNEALSDKTAIAAAPITRTTTAELLDPSRDALDCVMESFEEVVCGESSQDMEDQVRKNHSSAVAVARSGAALPSSSSGTRQTDDNKATTTRTATTGVVSTVKDRLKLTQEKIEKRVFRQKLGLRVLGGSCLPKPRGATHGENIDPYIIIAVHDMKREKNNGPVSWIVESHTSVTINDNGFCPVWNESEMKQFIIVSPYVAFVKFSLMESDIGMDERVAEAAIPISCLRKGYRSIQLYDANNTRTGPFAFASLLVEIQLTDQLL